MKSQENSQSLLNKSHFTKIGNRCFFKNGYSFPSAIEKVLLTFIAFTTSYVAILVYTIKYFTHNKLKYSVPIVNTITLLFNLYLFLQVSFTDPGVILPNKDNSNPSLKLPSKDEMTASIHNERLEFKFCPTCNVMRDLRVHHCSECNICVLRFDHHCDVLSTCIGLGNHRLFIILIAITIISLIEWLCIIIVLFGFVQYVQMDKAEHLEINALAKAICSLLVIFTSAALLFSLYALYSQIKLISFNETTCDDIKQYNKPHIYSIGSRLENIKEFIVDPLRYRSRIEYNECSLSYLSTLGFKSEKIGKYYTSQNEMLKAATLIGIE